MNDKEIQVGDVVQGAGEVRIKGLTLVRPWPYAILKLGKPIENRSWKPSANQLSVGDWIAIHAGKKWSQEDADWIASNFSTIVPLEHEHVSGAIVCLTQYHGAITTGSILRDSLSAKWFFGPYGWLLGNPIAIEPIPHRGAQGLWRVEMAAAEKLIAALKEQAK